MAFYLTFVAILIGLSAQALSQTPSCPDDKVYSDCGSVCPPTCENREPTCIQVCSVGCFCPGEQVLKNGACVDISQCDTDNVGENGDRDGDRDGGHDRDGDGRHGDGRHGDGRHGGRDGCGNCPDNQICKVVHRRECDSEGSESSDSESSSSESSSSESSNSESSNSESESDCEMRTYSICAEPPYVTCGSDAYIACDSEYLYCIQNNKTRRASCVSSCFGVNGYCEDDQVCTTTITEEGSTSLQCQDLNDLSSECPAGQYMNDCGNLCQQTCEDHLSGGKLCLEICAPPACMCPRGLVLFRDRCVDPRLCYVLMQYQPAINPLPLLSENQYLYSLITTDITITDFDQDSFLSAVQDMLAGQGFSTISVDLHGIHQDESLQIVIQLSGDDVNEDTYDQFTSILKVNSDSLPIQIQDVSMVDVDRVGKEKCFFRRHKILVAAAGASLLLTFLSIVMAVVSCCLCKNKRRTVPHRKLKMEFSDVIDDTSEKMKLEKELEALS